MQPSNRVCRLSRIACVATFAVFSGVRHGKEAAMARVMDEIGSAIAMLVLLGSLLFK